MLDRERGPGILIVVLLAMFGVFYTRTEPGAAPAVKADSPPAGSAKPAKAGEGPWTGQCLSGNEPVRFLCRFFGDASLEVREKPGQDWRTLPWVETVRGQKVAFLVVTVPDPDTTRLALYFDRTLASIQAAAASDNWRFDRIWLPWKAAGSSESVELEQQAAETLPGVMLFRGPDTGQAAVVFLVGESPVAGIRRSAFREAMGLIEVLSPKPPAEVRIAGPNFSGSFPSLRQEIDAVACRPEWKAVFRVVSPNTTVSGAQKDFTAANMVGQIRFSRILSNDDGTLAAFHDYMAAHWGREIRSAFVAEGETVYGLQKQDQQRTGQPFNFPREIALLRNLYPDAARQTFSPSGAQAAQSAADLKLRSGGKPTLPIFAEQQTVTSYEAQLLQIAQALDRDRYEFAGLAATDVLDMIYVSGYLRRAAPETRLFLLDADLLLVRATSSYSLDGTLLLTNFPLVLENRRWTGSLGRTPYASRWEMCVFNAVRALLLEGRANPLPLLEYSDPFRPQAKTPPIWLTAVSHDSLWPIAVLRETDPAGRLEWEPGEVDEASALRVTQPSLAWEVLTALLALAALAFAGLIAAACSRSARRSAEGLEALCFEHPSAGRAGRTFYLLAIDLLLAGMLIVQISPLLAVEQFRRDFTWHLVLPGLALAALALAGGRILFKGGRSFFENPGDSEVETPQLRKAFGLLTIGTGAAFVLFLIVWTICFTWTSRGARDESYFRAYRSIELFSGVSPLLPVLILCLSLLLLVTVHLRRYVLFVREHPFLPSVGSDPFLQPLAREEDPLLRLISWPILGQKDLPFALLGLLVIPLAMGGPQSLESWAYDLLYVVMLVLAVVLSTQIWLRFLLMWREIRAVLEALEAHPLRETFNALPPEFSEIPLFGGAGRYQTSIVFCRSLDLLRALETSRKLSPQALYGTESSQLESLTNKLKFYLGPDVDVPEGAMASHRSLDHEFCRIASRLLAHLSPHWAEGRSAREGAGRAAAEGWMDLAAEFIALRYAAYIRYVMLQLRNLLGFLTGGFFLTVFSGLVYPFRSQSLLGWVATGSVLVLGLPVLAALLRMDRDPLLARLRSKDGSAGNMRFLLRAAVYALPALAALAGTHFPGLGRFFGNWMAPALQALSK